MIFYAYVLRSEIDGRLYKRHTHRLKKRVEEDNLGKTRSKKGYRPWILVYYEEFETREEAIDREKYFKTGIGREYLKQNIRPRGATE